MDQLVRRDKPTGQATRYETACRAAGIGVWELHVLEDRLAYCEIARRIFGFPSSGEITRAMTHGAIHPEDLDVVLSAARRAMDPAVRADVSYTYRIRRHDTGALRWLRGHGIASFEGEGDKARAIFYGGSIEDITDLELTRRSLAESDERLRLAIDAAGLAVWDLDLRTGTVAHSVDLNRMLGFPPDAQPTLEELRTRYAPGERERMEAEGAAATARGETTLQSRVRYVVPGKGEVTYMLRAARAVTASGEVDEHRVIGVLFDVTAQARAEERLVTLAEELRHRIKNISTLAGIFAGQTWPADDRLGTYLGRIKALTMSVDLMFGPGKADLRLQDLVGRSLRPFLGQDAARFEIDGPDIALDDKAFTGIALVLHELATNAVKYGALSVPGGRVVLTWQVEDDELRIDWREVGGPPVHDPEGRGFGLGFLFRGALPPPHSVRLDFRPDGLVARIRVNLLA